MTDEKKYIELLKILGELIVNQQTDLSFAELQIQTLKERLSEAESQIETLKKNEK